MIKTIMTISMLVSINAFAKVQLLHNGIIHKKYLKDIDLEADWYALQWGTYVKKVSVTVTPEGNEFVRVSSGLQAEFLISGVGLKEDDRVTARLHRDKMNIGFSPDLSDVKIRVSGNFKAQGDDPPLITEYEVHFLDQSNKLLNTYRSKHVRKNPFRLIWSGDLNKDGYIDYVIDTNDISLRVKEALFLSDSKGGKRVMRLVGFFPLQESM